MSQEKSESEEYKLSIDEMHTLLRHRFGICNKEVGVNGSSISVKKELRELTVKEDLDYHTALLELQKSLEEFLAAKENIDKITDTVNHAISSSQPVALLNEVKVQYQIHVMSLCKAVAATLLEIGESDYIERIPHKLEKKSSVIAPLKTMNASNANASDPNHCEECSMKGIVIFGEKLIKINRGTKRNPSITLYKIQRIDGNKIVELIKKFLKSMTEPLEVKSWDKELNEALELEKTNKIFMKEHAIGSCAWVTVKLFLYSVIYAVIFQSLKELNAKEIVANKIAISVAEGWYKQFTIDDRTRAVYHYLKKFGLDIGSLQDLSGTTIAYRVQILKDFLNKENIDPQIDFALLQKIYLKSLNWLLAEYLNKGEIESAKNLLKTEPKDRFNPLFYAARNAKRAIAELLSNDPEYVNDKDKLGNTPLMLAAMRGNLDIAKILVKHRNKNNVDLKARNLKGETALHLAVLNNQREMVEYLLSHDGEMLNIVNNKGETPLQLAIDLEHEALVKLLSADSEPLKGQQKL